MATKARRSAKKKSARSGKKRSSARKSSARRASARKSAPKRKAAATKRRKQSPVSRVKRVTREVVQQAQVAVSAGVETLKDLGENLVDRYRS